MLSFLSFSALAQSDESVRAEDNQFHWQLSLGLFVIDAQMPKLLGHDSRFNGINVLADATIEYKNFYFDNKLGDFYGGADMGYQLLVEDNWGVDIIYGHYQLPFDEKGYFDQGSVVEELKGIKERKQDHSFGLSYYRTYGDFQTTVEVAYDLLGPSNGFILHLEATRNFEIRNWDLWLNFGVNFYSANFDKYYYGVSDSEATPTRPAYTPSGSTSVFVQFELVRPIADSWVFSSGASLIVGTPNVKDSPIIETNYAHVLYTGLKYVF